jgi:pyrroline-5-carboxylate reductase
MVVDTPEAIVHRLLLVGCGKMGSALLTSWRRTGVARHIDVVEPAGEIPYSKADSAVQQVSRLEDLPSGLKPEVVVLAVKPQLMSVVLPAYRCFVNSATVFLSIAASRSLAWLTGVLGSRASVVRAMPNTPAAVRRSITVLTASPTVPTHQRALCWQLMMSVGKVEWLEDEKLFDAVTAISGSGPAYVFLMIESLAAAGKKAGLNSKLAMHLARETVIGASILASESTADDITTLRKNVTSPGGTTDAALAVLTAEAGLPALLEQAVMEAIRRSKQLAI